MDLLAVLSKEPIRSRPGDELPGCARDAHPLVPLLPRDACLLPVGQPQTEGVFVFVQHRQRVLRSPGQAILASFHVWQEPQLGRAVVDP